MPETEPESQLELGADSGTSMLDSLPKSVPIGLLPRMSQPYALADWTRCFVTLMRSGMWANGIAYPLAPLARLTRGIGFGLLPTPVASNTKAQAMRSAGRPPLDFLKQWPTPRATDGDKGTRTTEGAARELARGKNVDLGVAVRMWPTPTASTGGNEAAKANGEGSGTGIKLATAVLLYPTPCARDWKDNGTSPAELARNSTTLATHAGGQLNPTWVEWLMGFPPGWTELDASATPSSRKSRKSYSGRSKTPKPSERG